MNLLIIVLGSILLSSPITTASFWDLSGTLNNLQNSLDLQGLLSKPQNALESVIGLTNQISNFTCISNAVELTLEAIKNLKAEIEHCGDDTPQDIKNVVKSTIDIARKAEHIRQIYNEECAEKTGLGCAKNMFESVTKLVESVYTTHTLIAKVPADPSVCGSLAVVNFGVTLSDLILSTKC